MARALAAALVFVGLTGEAVAEEFSPISTRDAFVNLIDGRALTRLGIRLEVTPGGKIEGRAFGTPVTGEWAWREGYFCRDLFYGERDLGPNCQEVSISGQFMRFQSDRGTGDYADLRIR